jgi:hypothetical protein
VAEHQVEVCSCSLNSYKCDFVSQFDIRLATRNVVHVVGVDDQDGEIALEQIRPYHDL